MSEGNAKATPSSSTGRKRKEAATPSTSPRKGKAIRLALETPHPAPEKWKETYAAIKDMRKEGGAPVDDMGCHMAGGPVSDPKTKRFVTLISLMLSSQTKDEVTHTAVVNLRTSLGELTVDNVLTAEEATISAAIAKVGFWRRKTQYIKQAAQKILDEFNGEIPNTVEGLCSLPGVGPKMAFLALQVAWNINVGIGVDVHVHRITNRLGWHKPSTKEPEQTRLNLQSWLPTDLHSEINPLLVGFGQTICLPVGPRCNACTLSVKNLCPSAKTDVKSKSRRAAPKVALPRVKVEIEEAVVDSDSKTTVQETVKVEERTVNSVTELDEGVKEET
ncbi:DNA glycosylase [Ramaria rubella]|nr:DNA glycosylase [Ramaria rubella]